MYTEQNHNTHDNRTLLPSAKIWAHILNKALPHSKWENETCSVTKSLQWNRGNDDGEGNVSSKTWNTTSKAEDITPTSSVSQKTAYPRNAVLFTKMWSHLHILLKRSAIQCSFTKSHKEEQQFLKRQKDELNYRTMLGVVWCWSHLMELLHLK